VSFIAGSKVGKNSHRILHILVDSESSVEKDSFTERVVSVGLASPYVAEKYYQILEDISRVMPISLLLSLADKPSLSLAHGQLFEIFAEPESAFTGCFFDHCYWYPERLNPQQIMFLHLFILIVK
jgi:hypothetical protein